MSEKKILILGVGNLLMCDEGFGVHAVNLLQQDYIWPENVRLMDGGTLGMLLMPDIQDCDKLIVLDAVLCDQPSGTFCILEGDDLRKSLGFRDSTHQTDLVDILICCELSGKRPETLVYGMEPFDWKSLQDALTPEANALLPTFCQKVIDALRSQNISIKRRNI